MWREINRDSGSRPVKDEADQSTKAAPAADSKVSKVREEELKLQEEEELQLAIALSRSEAEHKDKERGKVASARTYSSPVKEAPVKVQQASEIEDPELARYLNRSYWEQKQQDKENKRENVRDKEEKINDSMPHPSAPVTSMVPSSPNNVSKATEVRIY